MNWNHATWPGPTYSVGCDARRFAFGQPVAGEPALPSPPRMLGRSCPGSGPQVPRNAWSLEAYQPSEPELWKAMVAVDVAPGQSVG